jgi:argininosuccinate synthase
MKARIVLAYSGGLETTVAIGWLAATHGAEIIAVTIDLGQGRELDELHERALAAGAVRCHVLDARDEFARDYILPSLQADALDQGRYPLVTPLGRPLIAKKLVEMARIERATAIAHGCVEPTDQARLERCVRALDPAIDVLAPARVWGFTRAEAIAYAETRGVPVPATVETPYRVDANLWGRTIAWSGSERPADEFRGERHLLKRPWGAAASQPAYVEMTFEQGVPVAVNGVPMSLTELIESLTTIAGAHGVGRLQTARYGRAGIDAGTICEAPAAVVLHLAHEELERFVSAPTLNRFERDVATGYADLVYSGEWFSPLRDALDASVRKVQEHVTGVIRLELRDGACHVVGRQSPLGLHDQSRESLDTTSRSAEIQGFRG